MGRIARGCAARWRLLEIRAEGFTEVSPCGINPQPRDRKTAKRLGAQEDLFARETVPVLTLGATRRFHDHLFLKFDKPGKYARNTVFAPSYMRRYRAGEKVSAWAQVESCGMVRVRRRIVRRAAQSEDSAAAAPRALPRYPLGSGRYTCIAPNTNVDGGPGCRCLLERSLATFCAVIAH